MKYRHYIAGVLAIGAVACTPEQTSYQNESGAGPDKPPRAVAVSLETTPSTSGSAASALVWTTTDTSAAYIIGAVEDALEVYAVDGKRLSLTKADGEIESIDRLPAKQAGGEDLLLALDAATSTLRAYRMAGNALELAAPAILTSSHLLEGMCAYKSPLDGERYAFLLASNGQVEQWLLYEGTDGKLTGRLTRALQVGSEPKFCTVDDRANTLYVTEEAVGVWHFDADVEAETIPELVDVRKFGHFTGEVGGLALYHTPEGQGVLFASDVETSRINLYDTDADHAYLGSVHLKASGTSDGLDNAGALSSDGTLLLAADEDNGEEANNFKAVTVAELAAAFDFSATLAAPRDQQKGTFTLVTPSLETAPVADGGDAADDPAFWVHPTDPAKSLIIGTNKQGGLYVYNLDGSIRQYLADGKVNNVDIRYGVPVGGSEITLVAASNRTNESIALYRMDEDTGMLVDVADGVQPTDMADPYGLCMYQSPESRHTYVFINEKDGLVRQWRLAEGTPGRVAATPVREFIVGSTAEGCTADDDTGDLFVAEEDVALWKYGAEPEDGDARTKVTDPQMNPALKDDLEGVSIYYGEGGKGYIVLSSQGNNSYALFDRTAPHAYRGSFRVIADSTRGIDGSSETDGLDVISTPLGPKFPYGAFIAQDGRNIAPAENQNFKLVPWERIAEPLSLEKHTDWSPR